MLQSVPFLSIEVGDDLIVSFALDEHAASSLTLVRTPKLEHLLDDDARGVAIGGEASDAADEEMLVGVHWQADRVDIETTARTYAFDVSRVDPDELRDARKVLRKMNFDRRFRLTET